MRSRARPSMCGVQASEGVCSVQPLPTWIAHKMCGRRALRPPGTVTRVGEGACPSSTLAEAQEVWIGASISQRRRVAATERKPRRRNRPPHAWHGSSTGLGPMRATEYLRRQHRSVDGLFARIGDADAENRGVLVHELALSLVAHSVIETEILYPFCLEEL